MFLRACYNTDVDECASKPCKNGGKCENKPGGYRCTCVGGWFTGKNCDEGRYFSRGFSDVLVLHIIRLRTRFMEFSFL